MTGTAFDEWKMKCALHFDESSVTSRAMQELHRVIHDTNDTLIIAMYSFNLS